MRPALAALLVLAAALPAGADPLAGYRWEKRPVVVFAPGPGDARLAEQLERFAAARDALEERATVVIVDAEGPSALRDRFDPTPFAVILVGKDGAEKFRSPEPVPVEALSERIDAMPMRRREMRESSPG